MKVTIDIDCTPSEARRFMGLPDFEPLQAAMTSRMEKEMLEQMSKLSPEALLKSWFTVGSDSAERLQGLMAAAFGQANRPKSS